MVVWWYGVTSNELHHLLLLCTTLHYLFPSTTSNIYHIYILSSPVMMETLLFHEIMRVIATIEVVRKQERLLN
jgi:hypothetical protein